MPVFTNYLRRERSTLRSGLELLESYRRDLATAKPVPIADLRMAIYTLQTAFEGSHMTNEETLLFPAVSNVGALPSEIECLIQTSRAELRKCQEKILSLRVCIDEYERDPEKAGLLNWHLAEIIDQIQTRSIGSVDKIYAFADTVLGPAVQSELLHSAQRRERANNMNQPNLCRQIFNQLRLAKGLPVAS